MSGGAQGKDTPLLGGAQPRSSWVQLCEEFLADLGAAAVAVVLSCLSQIGYAGVIASGEGLGQHFVPLVQQAILSVGVGSLWYFASSQFRVMSNTDTLVANFMVQAAAITARHFPHRPELQAGHAFLLMSLLTAAFGAVSMLLARFRTGFMLRFIPYTVTGGLVGGFGLITVNLSVDLALGTDAVGAVKMVLARDPFPALQMAGMFVVALLATLAPRSPLSTPLITLGVTAAFHLLLPGSVTSDEDWYLALGAGVGQDSGEAGVVSVWGSVLAAFADFHPRAVFNTDALRLFATFFGVTFINWGVHLPAMNAIIVKRFPGSLDLDKEIQVFGVSDVVAGALGGQPVCHALQIPLLVQTFGKRIWPLMTGGILIAVAITNSWTAAKYVPRFVFAGLMVTGGVALLKESMVEAKHRIALSEWQLLVLTAVIVWIDAMVGLVVGLCLALVFSMYEYIGISGVKQHTSMAATRSAVERASSEERAIQARADEVEIFWLYGYLFFGSIVRAVDEVHKVARAGARWIILDLTLVPAIDASGVHGLVDLAGELARNGVKLILTGMVRRLALAVENAGGVPATAETLDFGLQRIEEDILGAADVSPASPEAAGPPQSAEEAWALAAHRLRCGAALDGGFEAPWQKVAAISVLRTEDPGVLFREGDTVAELFVLLGGTVQLETWPKQASAESVLPRWHLNEKKGDQFVFEDHPQRLRVTSNSGSVINPAECMYAIAGARANAQFTARALTRVSLLVVPFEGLTQEVAEGFFQRLLVRALAASMSPAEEPQVAPIVLGSPAGLVRAVSMGTG